MDTTNTTETDPETVLARVRAAALNGAAPPEPAIGRLTFDPATVRQELDWAFSRSGSAVYLRALDQAGLLFALLPELAPMKGCAQPKEHYYDVFDHTIEAVAAVDMFVGELPAIAAGSRPDSVLHPTAAAWLIEHLTRPLPGGGDPLRLTRWSALLHDVAKPATRSVQPNGRTRFFGHPELGARLAREILGRLDYPEEEIAFVERLVDMHLRPGQLGEAEPTDRALRRFFDEAGPGAAGLLILNLADGAAAQGPRLTQEAKNRHLAYVGSLIARRDAGRPVPPPLRLVTGHDLMDHLGLGPGPELGAILKEVAAAQTAGHVADREAALSLAAAIHQGRRAAD